MSEIKTNSIYLVTRLDGHPLCCFGKEYEAYQLAELVDGLVEHLTIYRVHLDAVEADSSIAYEADRPQGLSVRSMSNNAKAKRVGNK